MILFEKRLHDNIREGKITLTFRLWDTLKVLRGKIYRSHNLGLLRVLDVDFKKIQHITPEEVRRCGYDTLDDLKTSFSNDDEMDMDDEYERVVRIEFEYIGEDIENYKKAMGNVKDSEIFKIKEQLLVLEQKNKTPWIRKTFQLLKDKDCMLTKDLEAELGIPAERIKQYMRKLKTLHLVSSNSRKGYSITPLGSKLLKHFNARHDNEDILEAENEEI